MKGRLTTVVSLLAMLLDAPCSLSAFSVQSTTSQNLARSKWASTRLYGLLNANEVEGWLVSAIFDSVESPSQPTAKDRDPEQVLDLFMNLCTDVDSQIVADAETSLQRYLELWVLKQLSQDPSLTTPVMPSSFQQTKTSDANVVTESRMKLMFRPPKRYMSYKEQKAMDKGVLPDRKGAKLDSKSPGGVAMVMQTIAGLDSSEDLTLQLTVARCGVDSDTIIKERSERAIVRRLAEAIKVWRKVRALPI